MAEKQASPFVPLEGLSEILEAWGPSVRQGLLLALLPEGRAEDEEFFIAWGERIGTVFVRNERGWSFSYDDPSQDVDAKFATGHDLAALVAVLFGVPIEEVPGLVGAAVLGVGAGGPGEVTWHDSYSAAQKWEFEKYGIGPRVDAPPAPGARGK